MPENISTQSAEIDLLLGVKMTDFNFAAIPFDGILSVCVLFCMCFWGTGRLGNWNENVMENNYAIELHMTYDRMLAETKIERGIAYNCGSHFLSYMYDQSKLVRLEFAMMYPKQYITYDLCMTSAGYIT